jgi:hypothetical protein
MAYWCDDEALRLDQKRRDAEQERGLRSAAEAGKPWAIQMMKELTARREPSDG